MFPIKSLFTWSVCSESPEVLFCCEWYCTWQMVVGNGHCQHSKGDVWVSVLDVYLCAPKADGGLSIGSVLARLF